ncbi:MAG TPA: hypothetical protein VJR89_30815 [Polyangiales bacterium]|nr:hypothetical protein [Polyangiales bacterium]
MSYRAALLGLLVAVVACSGKDTVGTDLVTDESSVRGNPKAAGNAADTSAKDPQTTSPANTTGAAGSAAGASGSSPPKQGSSGSPSSAGRGGAGSGGSGGSQTPAAGTGSPAAGSGGAPPSTAAGTGGTGDSGGSGGSGGGEPQAGAAAEGGEAMGAADPECDMTGVWIARLTTFSRDSVFSAVQTTSNWFYYEFEQTGRTVRIKKQLDCGFQVSGSADVTLNKATVKALLTRNEQSGRREGEFYKDGERCAFKLQRFYSVRGAQRDVYLTGDLSKNPALSSLTPALPTESSPAGAEDWDMDGKPGIAVNVAGLGSRHVVQRDWNEFFSEGMRVPALNAKEFAVRADFDSQESILATSGGLGALLRAGASPATGMQHRITFRLLGRDPNDAAVSAVRVADDVETCFNIQDALPHDPAMQ